MKITIDGLTCEAEYGEFILDVAKRNGISIPTLCHSEALPGQGNCRLCIVEVIDRGRSKVVTSCIFPLTKEVKVITNSPKIIKMRKTIVKLLLARTPNNAYIKKLADDFGVTFSVKIKEEQAENCILCGLCVRACAELGSHAIATVSRGINKKISTPFDEPAPECIGCGACAAVCPTEAIAIKDEGNCRTMWNKEFALLACPNCGEYYLTEEQRDYLLQKEIPAEDLQLCTNCKKKLLSKKMKDIYGKNFSLNTIV